MSRWSKHDEDSYRLPEGMVRIGYDADTQRYTFRDKTDGSHWESLQGSTYGPLRRVTTSRISRAESYSSKNQPLSQISSAATSPSSAKDFSEILRDINRERSDSEASRTASTTSSVSKPWQRALTFATVTSRLMLRPKSKAGNEPFLEEKKEPGVEKSEYTK